MSDDRPSTKDRLLAAAEKLFAERGFDGASVRDLAAEAGVNVAAVNYHFQGKENLYHAVLLRRLKHKRETSLSALQAAPRDAEGRPVLEALIRGFVGQYLEEILATPQGSNFMRLIARELHDPQRGGEVFLRELVIPVHENLTTALMEAAPGLDRELASWAFMSLMGQITHTVMRWYKREELTRVSEVRDLAGRAFPHLAQPRDDFIRAAVDNLTRFSVGGVLALAARSREVNPTA